jgi:hypothetical protein
VTLLGVNSDSSVNLVTKSRIQRKGLEAVKLTLNSQINAHARVQCDCCTSLACKKYVEIIISIVFLFLCVRKRSGNLRAKRKGKFAAAKKIVFFCVVFGLLFMMKHCFIFKKKSKGNVHALLIFAIKKSFRATF